jgi:hypothetical protein
VKIEDAAKFIRAIKIDGPTLLLCDPEEIDFTKLASMRLQDLNQPVLLMAVRKQLSIKALTLKELKDAVALLEGKIPEVW